MKPKPPKLTMKDVSKRIRNMDAGDVILFKDGSPSSIRTTLTRIREEYKREGRGFVSKKVTGGVRVWRLV